MQHFDGGMPMDLLRMARVTAENPNRVRHYIGLPPMGKSESDTRTLLPIAAVIVLIHREEGYFLYRYTADRHFLTDTWHMTIEDAEHQAEFEYGIALADWTPISAQVRSWFA